MPAGRPGLTGPRGQVDRHGLAAAHAVTIAGIDPQSPLTVGNGELCFTVDATGLQTWPELYPVADPAGGPPGTLLSTLSSWGWHSLPGGEDYDVARCARPYATRRGPVPYVDLSRELEPGTPGASLITPEEEWLRGNPHRLDLLRMGFVVPGAPGWRAADPGEGRRFVQELDVRTGVIGSAFRLGEAPVTVASCCYPAEDVIAVRVTSPLLAAGRLAVRLAFPYGCAGWARAADWTRPDAHETAVRGGDGGCVITRSLDGRPAYTAVVSVSPGAAVAVTGRHEVTVSSPASRLEITVRLSPAGAGGDPSLSYTTVEAASRDWWSAFWSRGAAVDVTGSADPRAPELQRRIVLSQYLTAVNCAGSLPPQETGLTASSWSGKFHLEMHWWHAAHFALWGRPDLLERSLGWYERILPAARRTAAGQGYAGARWPKQCGPDGRESPSPISPFLIWQQPHPIHLAELARIAGTADAVRRYADVVLESARFMASFAERTPRGFELGPPLVPAQESYAADRARLANPAFELAYWSWALDVAQRWRSLLGLAPEPLWSAVADGLVRPGVRDGVYAAVGVPHRALRTDHPSMLYGYGFVPPTAVIDPAVMRATLRSVLAGWDWASAWGWDFPAIAMTAARLGEPRAATGALLMDTPKNTFLPSGHCRQGASLPVYLPANGGLLAAVALMAGAGGFPENWHVICEGGLP